MSRVPETQPSFSVISAVHEDAEQIYNNSVIITPTHSRFSSSGKVSRLLIEFLSESRVKGRKKRVNENVLRGNKRGGGKAALE